MDFAVRMRNALIASTRGYFATTSDVIVSEYDVAYYSGEDFFDRKHRLNVHYHASPAAPPATSPTEEDQSPPTEEPSGDELRPKPKKLPVVVFIHGGGWKRGDRNYIFDAYNNFGKAIAAEGFVVVVPSYRLSIAVDGGVQHPKHVHDVAHALRWVKDNIGRYNGDEDMIFLSGHSAGGHLAALLALDTHYMADVGLEPELVKGVVGICGVYDLVTGYTRFLLRNLYLADAFGHDQAVLREASPVHHARSNAPPFMLFNAAMDFGLEDDSLRLRAELAARDGSVAHRSFPGTDHGSIIGLGPAWGRPYAPLVRETCAWLNKQIAAITDDRETKNDLRTEDEEQKQQRAEADEGEGSPAEAHEGSRSEADVMVLRAYGWE